jgi:hypothetical protein
MKKIIFMGFFFLTLTTYSQKVNYFYYNNFLLKYVTEKGVVDYDKIYQNKSELREIIEKFEKIKPTIYWTNNENLAFWINVYNLYSIKLVIDNYPIKSIKEINNAWKKDFIVFNGIPVSLDYIDEKVLRPLGDPRYHFAINCTSYSCPAFLNEAYDYEKIDSQLQNAAELFINDASKNEISSRKATISKVFDWYQKDFTTKGTLIQFLNEFSKTKLKDDAVITFQEYNWKLSKVER